MSNPKNKLKILFTASLILGLSVFAIAEETLLIAETSPYAILSVPYPPSNIVITSPDGRAATIDFGGKEIIYSGDLPVAESARLFFDAFVGLFNKRCEQLAIKNNVGR